MSWRDVCSYLLLGYTERERALVLRAALQDSRSRSLDIVLTTRFDFQSSLNYIVKAFALLFVIVSYFFLLMIINKQLITN